MRSQKSSMHKLLNYFFDAFEYIFIQFDKLKTKKGTNKVDLQKRIKEYQDIFHHTCDLIVRTFESADGIPCALIYLDNAVDKLLLAESVIEKVQRLSIGTQGNQAIDACEHEIVAYVQVDTAKDTQDAVDSILTGFAMLLVDGSDKILKVQCAKWFIRSPSEPPTSAVVKGPREGFVEDINTNLSLLRKRLKSNNLVIEQTQIGRETNTQVRICYLQNLASPKIVAKIREQINQIDIDGVVDSSYISAFLGHNRHSMFKQIGSTEKPDIAAAKILEGRVAIMVDNSPIVLTVPFLLLEDLQNSDDYYSTPAKATFLRWLRLIGAMVAILLPGIYVAMTLYHYNVIPIKFLVTITNSIQGIPLPPFLETLFIILLFETLYEASLRMPRYLGLALSVVGALILGDTAVKAGLISSPAVLIVAVTGVMSYTIPEQSSQISLLRIIFTFVGGILGLYGMIVGAMILIAYLVNMNTYQSSYLAPFAPYISNDQKDALIKKPTTSQITRPNSIPNINHRRLADENDNSNNDS